MFKWANFFGKSEAERTIFSPNGRVEAHFILKSGELFYNVFRDHKNIVRTSRLGFLICGENPLGKNLKLIREHSKKVDEVFELPWGEERYIKNNYTETAFYLSETNDSRRIFTLRFRVFEIGRAHV